MGPLNAYLVYLAASIAILFSWIGVHTESGILAFCAFYGIASSGLINLPANVVAAALTPDMRQFGTRFGMQSVVVGIGTLIGNPIAGAIVAGSWLGLQSFAAFMIVAPILLYDCYADCTCGAQRQAQGIKRVYVWYPMLL